MYLHSLGTLKEEAKFEDGYLRTLRLMFVEYIVSKRMEGVDFSLLLWFYFISCEICLILQINHRKGIILQ